MKPASKLFLPLVFAALVVCGIGGRFAYNTFTSQEPQAVVAVPEKVVVEEKANPVFALANLTDFKKTQSLNVESRAINQRLNKVLYWLYVADRKGISPERAIGAAFSKNRNSDSGKAAQAREQLLRNYRAAQIYGLFTPENLPKLKRGKQARISCGAYTGQFTEIDHIVPLSRFPEFANDFANLQILPQSENRAKGDKMGPDEIKRLKELQGEI